MTFPEDWPDGCPPTDSVPAADPVYRIVRTNPPTGNDFQTFSEKGRPVRKQPECPCMLFGLSVFRDREDAFWMSRSYPKLGAFLASGTLAESNGQVKPTKGQRPTHTTWWPTSECDRLKPFANCEEVV